MLYLIYAYRDLLSRAQQGIVVFIPSGDVEDPKRSGEFYVGTYAFCAAVAYLTYRQTLEISLPAELY